MPEQKTLQNQALKNPSYDNSLTAKQRLADFLGAYHVVLNGVVAHDPFEKYEEDGGGMCCQDSKERLIEFVELLLSQAVQKAKEE